MNDNPPLPDGYVAHLPTPVRISAPRHKFGDPVSVPASKSASGQQQTERTCTLCRAVKVTVHGPGDDHYRAWRTSADAEQVETFAALRCELQP